MDTEASVDERVDRWEMMGRQGTPPTVEELCADRPDLVPEVRRRIEGLRAMESALGTGVRGPRPTADVPARPDGELHRVSQATAVYRTRGHHDQGGLGVVYTAHQEELDRTVALKRIRPDRLRDSARRRFVREAVLTARLQHPGIVPIYDLGHDEGGPFYTMPFIEGRTLQEAIDTLRGEAARRRDAGEPGLWLRGMLQHFIAACNTVAYAHDQGVVHRDLKPSNIMLGPYGETFVMDWGLAKRFGTVEESGEGDVDVASPEASPEDVTATGEVLGTPQYMSPEQARGEPAGPAGDIFILGLVLNTILTGRSAFDESSPRGPDRLQAVRDAAVVPPRRRDPRLPRALEAICLKAMAPRPEARYASARALADDVTKWLADEPVSAWREPAPARARRWMRGHRPAVAAAAVALAAVAVGLAAVATLQARSNVRLRAAVARTDEALAAMKAARARTQAALEQSQESRRQAEAARLESDAVTRVLLDAFRSPDPGQVDRDVKVADVLDRASRNVDKELADSPRTLGTLLHTLGTTYMGMGRYDRAVTLLTRARAVREAALGPDHLDTIKTCNHLANAYRLADRLPETIALAEETLRRREAALGPDHLETLKSRSNLALAYLDAGRLPEAIAMHREVFDRMAARLGADDPQVLTCRHNLAIDYYRAGRLSEAIELHEGTRRLIEAKLGPDHPQALNSRYNLAVTYADAGRLPEAIALLEETLRLAEARLGPGHSQALTTRIGLANAYDRAGRWSEAVALHEATLRLTEAKLGPDHRLTLINRHNLASAYAKVGRVSESVGLFESILAPIDARLGPDHSLALTNRNSLATMYESLGRTAEAEGLYRQVLARRRKVVPPGSPPIADDLIALGRHLLGQSRWSEAEPMLREALTIRERATPDDWSRFDAMSLLGAAMLGQGRHAEAGPLIVDGYEGMRAREARINVPERPRLREAAERVIRLYEAWGRPGESAAWKTKVGMPDLPAEVFARP